MNRVWPHHFHIGIIATVELKQSSSSFSFYPSLLFPSLCCITVRWECLHTDCEREKKVDFHHSSACRLHADPGNDILLKAVGGKRDWKIILSLLFFCSFVCFSLLPLFLQSPFPQVLVLRLADGRIVLPREINYSLFFVNSFPNQMLVHHILVIKQITSGAAEHRNTNFVWSFLLIYGRQKWHWCYWNQSQQAQTYNCVSLSRTF